jgi:pimeloyl-ACP methyl ester carboxylesterase
MAAALAAPLLVMHDRDDPTVPWAEGAAIASAWRGAELVTTSGLGHRDIVRDPDVVARAVAFLRRVGISDTN